MKTSEKIHSEAHDPDNGQHSLLAISMSTFSTTLKARIEYYCLFYEPMARENTKGLKNIMRLTLLSILIYQLCSLRALQITKIVTTVDFQFPVRQLCADIGLTTSKSEVLTEAKVTSTPLEACVQDTQDTFAKTNVMAFEEDTLVGNLDIIQMAKDHYRLVNLVVHPQFRRLGIASRLLEAVVTEVVNNTPDSPEILLELDVDKSNSSAAKLYMKAGFRPTPGLRSFLEGLITHRTRMHKVIKRKVTH
jgi:ribosomal protein S18 acetylase RimI-like enzyme